VGCGSAARRDVHPYPVTGARHLLEAARALDYSDAVYILAQGDRKEGFMLQAMIEDRLAGQALIAFYCAPRPVSLFVKSVV
jgi:hypothetical protein